MVMTMITYKILPSFYYKTPELFSRFINMTINIKLYAILDALKPCRNNIKQKNKYNAYTFLLQIA
jgi:hypothetical protein